MGFKLRCLAFWSLSFGMWRLEFSVSLSELSRGRRCGVALQFGFLRAWGTPNNTGSARNDRVLGALTLLPLTGLGFRVYEGVGFRV